MEDAGREREAAYLVSLNRGGLSPNNGLSGQQYPLEQEMALHSSILGWKIPWAKEPDGLQSMGSQRVEQDRLCLHTHAHTHTQLYEKVTSPE